MFKKDNAPFAALLFPAFLLLFILFMWVFALELSDLPYFLLGLVCLAILVGEALIYWHLRTWNIRQMFIWIHILGLYCTMFVLPYLDVLVFVARDTDRLTSNDLAIEKMLPTLYWAVPVFAHIFFFAAVLEALRNKRRQ